MFPPFWASLRPLCAQVMVMHLVSQFIAVCTAQRDLLLIMVSSVENFVLWVVWAASGSACVGGLVGTVREPLSCSRLSPAARDLLGQPYCCPWGYVRSLQHSDTPLEKYRTLLPCPTCVASARAACLQELVTPTTLLPQQHAAAPQQCPQHDACGRAQPQDRAPHEHQHRRLPPWQPRRAQHTCEV